MGSKGGRAPPPPDPTAVATAQTGSNVQTATANAYLNNVNQYGPRGSITYERTGTEAIRNPDGTTSDVPIFAQHETLSPNQQTLATQQENLGIGLNDIAGNQLTRLAGVLGRPVYEDLAGVPAIRPGFDAGGPIQTSVDYAYAPTSFGDTAGRIQYDVPGGTDFSALGQQAQDAILARMRPELERSQAALDSRLANQGIALGADAYRTAQTIEQQRTNDARLAAVREGYALENQLYNQALAGGQFHNAAQAQDYGQQLGRGQFAQSGIGQNNAVRLNAAQFANAAQAQQFGQNQTAAQFNNQAAQQALQQALALRNQPLNEIGALMSGGQVSLPQFQGYTPAQVAGTPIGQYMYNAAGIQQQQYEAEQNRANALRTAALTGLFGLGSAAIRGPRTG